jgi:hypothetical protein
VCIYIDLLRQKDEVTNDGLGSGLGNHDVQTPPLVPPVRPEATVTI